MKTRKLTYFILPKFLVSDSKEGDPWYAVSKSNPFAYLDSPYKDCPYAYEN